MTAMAQQQPKAAPMTLEEFIADPDIPRRVGNEGPLVPTSLRKRGRIPDVWVSCTPDTTDDPHTVEPCLVVEVLSPSTTSIDTNIKVKEYLALDHIMHYLIVDPEERTAMLYSRMDPQAVKFFHRDDTDTAIQFEVPNIAIELADCFEQLPAVSKD